MDWNKMFEIIIYLQGLFTILCGVHIVLTEDNKGAVQIAMFMTLFFTIPIFGYIVMVAYWIDEINARHDKQSNESNDN